MIIRKAKVDPDPTRRGILHWVGMLLTNWGGFKSKRGVFQSSRVDIMVYGVDIAIVCKLFVFVVLSVLRWYGS